MPVALRSYMDEQIELGNIDSELEMSLLDKMDAAKHELEKENPNNAKINMNDLKALINQVEAQADKKIAPETAAEVIEHASVITAALGV